MQLSQQTSARGDLEAYPAAPWTLIAVIAVVLGTAFFINEVDWRVSTYENYSLEADDAEALVATGSSSRKVTYAAIGLLGATLLLVSSAQPRQFVSPAIVLLASYVLLCGVSVLWSDDPALSLKRAAVLAFCTLGVAGVAKHLNGVNLLNLSILIALLLVGIGLAAELALGTFQPFGADYRFAGTVHPNTQGAYCAVLAIAGFFGAKKPSRGRVVYLAIFAIGIGLLLLTKSRASCAGCMFALAAAWLLSVGNVARTFAGIAGPFAICLILIAALLSGMEVVGELDRAARLGRTGLESGVAGLNGRVPLWADLMSYVQQRPLLGYGYNGFWTPTRIYEISSEQEWTIATAHSVFLDVLLNVGVIGGFFFVTGIALAVFQAGRRCVQTRTPGDGFVFALAAFAAVSGVFESGFAQPAGFDSFVAACGLMYVVMVPAGVASRGPDPRPPQNCPASSVPWSAGGAR